jgi:hypothetical protein
MLPNVRLQIVALFVSVVALSFGFGVFAAFRVNHEPLVQVPAAAAPLPPVAENATPSGTTASWGAPFGSRFWLSETQIHGAADLPPLTPVVRRDVTERTITWIVVNGSVVGAPAPAPALQPPPALPDVQSVDAPLAPKQGGAIEEAAAPADGAGPVAGPAAVVGAAEPAAQVQPEVTSTVPEHATQEPKALRAVPASTPRKAAHATLLRRHVAIRAPVRPQIPVQSASQNSKVEEPVVFQSAPRVPARAPVRPQTRVQSAGQNSKVEEPVVFQSAPPQQRPQKGTPVASRSGSQNSMVEAPVFQTAPPSQH